MKQKSFFIFIIFYMSFFFQTTYILSITPIANNIKIIFLKNMEKIKNNAPLTLKKYGLLNNLTQLGIMHYSRLKNQKEYFINDSDETPLYIKHGLVGSLLKYNNNIKSTYKNISYITSFGLELAWKISINDLLKNDLLSKGTLLLKYQWFISFGLLFKFLEKEKEKLSYELINEPHILKIIKNDILEKEPKKYKKKLKLYLSLTIDFLIPFKFISNFMIQYLFMLN